MADIFETYDLSRPLKISRVLLWISFTILTIIVAESLLPLQQKKAYVKKLALQQTRKIKGTTLWVSNHRIWINNQQSIDIGDELLIEKTLITQRPVKTFNISKKSNIIISFSFYGRMLLVPYLLWVCCITAIWKFNQWRMFSLNAGFLIFVSLILLTFIQLVMSY